MADIGSLIVRIGADASGLQKAFSDLGGSGKQFQRGIETIGKVAAAAFAAVTASMVAMTLAAGRQAEELQQLSTITGIGTDKLQEYDVLMNRVGLGAADMTTMMRTLSKNMEDAQNGTGNAAARFRQLNIDIRKVTSTDDLIRKIADSLSKFANGTQKAAIESDLLGKGGLRLALAMEGGAKGIDEAASASMRLGAALSSGQLAELATMDDRIDDLTLAWKRFGQQVGSFVAPAIDFAARALSNLLNMASQGLKGLNALGGVGETPDDRPQPPKLIDESKLAAHAQSMADLRLRTQETYNQDALALAKSSIDHEMVLLDQQKAFYLHSDAEIALSRQQAIARMDAFTVASLKKQLQDFKNFVGEKRRLYTDDEKGRAELLKFQEESAAKEMSMTNRIFLAQQEAKTNFMRAGLAVRTFWQQQLDGIVQSNTFSVGLIVNTWTSGVANAIVSGGDFVKQAWKATEIAVIQGALNMAVQWAAKQALMLLATETTQAAITSFFGLQETARTAIAVSGSKAAAAASTAALAGVVSVGTATMGVLAAVLEGIVGFMLAVAAAVAPVPLIGQAMAGAIIVGATLAQVTGAAAIAAATAALGVAAAASASGLAFDKGGVGDFGSGTPAMLHGPEAIIPLNDRGAGFMREAFGSGDENKTIHTHVYLNKRQIALAVSDQQPGALRDMGVLGA